MTGSVAGQVFLDGKTNGVLVSLDEVESPEWVRVEESDNLTGHKADLYIVNHKRLPSAI